MRPPSINLMDYNPLSSNLLPSRILPASVTPRRAIPVVLALVVLFTLSSFRHTGSDVTTYAKLGRGTNRIAVRPAVDDWAKASEPLQLNADVEERIRAWELAPLGEPADWVKESVKVRLYNESRGWVMGKFADRPPVLAAPCPPSDLSCVPHNAQSKQTAAGTIASSVELNEFHGHRRPA